MAGIKAELVGVSEYVFTARIRPRLVGLNDDEYLWEPVAGCWSLRPDPEGVFRLDTARLLTRDRHPFTTLAWRLWHLIGCFGSQRNARWLGVESTVRGFDGFDAAPPNAAAALDALDAAYGSWTTVLAALTDDDLETKIGPIGGEYADATKASFVMHQIDEVIHHGSEVALMRDLYRATVLSAVPASDSVTSVVHAAATGYWADVRSLIAAGGDVAGTQEHDFNRTALHYAASAAPLDVVKLLVERGADLAAKDAQFDATPLGWAEYFGRDDIAEYLRAR